MKQRFRGLWAGVMLLAIALVGCPSKEIPGGPGPTDIRLITGKVMVPGIISNGTAKIISNGGAKIISNGGAKYRIAATASEMESAPAKNYAVILQDAHGNFLGDGVETDANGTYTLSVRLGVVIPAGQNKSIAQVVAYNDAKAVVSAQVILDRNSASGKPISVNLDKVSTLMAMTGKAAIAAGKDAEQAINDFQAQTAAGLLDVAGEALMSVAVADLAKIDDLVNLDPDTISGDNPEQQMLEEIQTKMEEAEVVSPPELEQVIEKAKDIITTAPPQVIATPAPPTPAPNTTPTPAPTARPTVAPTATPSVAPTAVPTAAPTATPTPTPLVIYGVEIAIPATNSINAMPESGPADPEFGPTSVQLNATVTSNKVNTGVNWSILSGNAYAELTSVTGTTCVVQSLRQTEAGDVVIKATSKNDGSKSAQITIRVTINGGVDVEVQ